MTFSRSEKRLAFYAQRRPLAERSLRLQLRAQRRRAAHDVAQHGDRPRGPRRRAGRALQVVRRDGHPEHPLSSRTRPPRQRKAPALVWVHGGPGGQTTQRLQRAHPVPRQPRLRGARHQQPRQLGLRQDVLRGGRPEARPRAALGLRRGEEVPREPALRRRRPHRHHRRQLRRLHGAGRARLPARRVRRRRRHLRRLELAADAREHPALVGGAAQGALRRDRATRPTDRRCCARSRRSSTPTRSASR